jgi:hypothetical protein
MPLTREQQIELLKQKLLAPRPTKTSEGDFQAQTSHFTKELALLQQGQEAVDVSDLLPQAEEDVSDLLAQDPGTSQPESVDVSDLLPPPPSRGIAGTIGFMLEPYRQAVLGAGAGATLGATNLLPGQVEPQTGVEKAGRQLGELAGSLLPFSKIVGGVNAIAAKLGVLQASPRLKAAVEFGLANGVMDVLHIDQRGLSERFDPTALGFSIGGGAVAGVAAAPTAKGALELAKGGGTFLRKAGLVKSTLPFYSRGELALRMGGASFLTGRLPGLIGEPIQQSPIHPTGIPWIDDFLWDMGTAAAVLPGSMKVGSKIPIVAFRGNEIIPTDATIIGTDLSGTRTAYRLRLPDGKLTTYIPGSRITLDTAPPPKSTVYLQATAGGRLPVNDGDLVSVPGKKGTFAVGRFRGYSIDENKRPWWHVDMLAHVGDTKGATVFLDATKVDLRHLDQVKGRDWSRMNPVPVGSEPEPVTPQPGSPVTPPPIIAPPVAGGRAVSAAGTLQPGGEPFAYVPGGTPAEVAAARTAQAGAETTVAAQTKAKAEADAAFAAAKGTRPKLQAEEDTTYHTEGIFSFQFPPPDQRIIETDPDTGLTILGPSTWHNRMALGYMKQVMNSLPPDMRQQMVKRIEIVDNPGSFTRAWHLSSGVIGLNLSNPFPAKQTRFNKENLGYLRLPAPDQFVASIAHEFAHRKVHLEPAPLAERAYAALGWTKVDRNWIRTGIGTAPNTVSKEGKHYEFVRGLEPDRFWAKPSLEDLPVSMAGPEEELARAVQSYVLNPELLQRNNPRAFNAVQTLFQGTPFEIRGATTTLEGQRKLFTEREMAPLKQPAPHVEQPAPQSAFQAPVVTQEIIALEDGTTTRRRFGKIAVRGASRFVSRPTPNNPEAPWIFDGYHGSGLRRPPSEIRVNEYAPGRVEMTPFEVHIGTPLAALMRIRAKGGRDQRIYPARVILSNPMGSPELPVSDHGTSEFWQRIITIAKKRGHDGIIYRNGSEDPNSLSVIAFDPKQLDYRGQPTLPGVAQDLNAPNVNLSELPARLSADIPDRQAQMDAALKTIFDDPKLTKTWEDGLKILEGQRNTIGKLIDFNAAEPFLEQEMTLYVLKNKSIEGLKTRLLDRVKNIVRTTGVTAPASLEEPGVLAAAEGRGKLPAEQAPPKAKKPAPSNAVVGYYEKLRGTNPNELAGDIARLPAQAQDFMRSMLGVNESGKQTGPGLPWLESAKTAGYDNPGSVLKDLKIGTDGRVAPRPKKSAAPLSDQRLFFKWKQLKKMLRERADPLNETKLKDVEAEMNRRGLSLELPAPPPKGEKLPLAPRKGPPGPPAPPTFTPGDYILEPVQPSAIEFTQHIGKQRLKPLNFVLKRKTDGTVLGTYAGTQVRPDIRAQTRYDIHFAGYFGPAGERSATPKAGHHTRFLVHDLLSGTDVGYFTPRGVQRIMRMDYHPGAGFDPTTGELQPSASDIARSLQSGPRPVEARVGTSDLRREEFLNLTGPEQMAHLWSLTMENAKTPEAAWNSFANMNGMISGYPERGSDQVKLADALKQRWGPPPGLAGHRVDILDAIDKAAKWRKDHQEMGLRELAEYASPNLGGSGAAFRQSREARAFLQILDKLIMAPDIKIDEPGNPLNAGRLPVGSNVTPAARTMLLFGHPLMADMYQKTRLSETYMHALTDQWAVKYAAIRERLPLRDLLLIARIAEGRFQPGEKLRVASKSLLQERGFVPLRGTRTLLADLRAMFGNIPVHELLLPEPASIHYVKAQQLRALLDEIQTVGKLPAERYIPNYLSHVFHRNPGGWLELPVDMNPGEEVFLRFFQKRASDAPDYDVNLDEVMDLYIRGAARKVAFDPILEEFYRPEVMNALPPAQRNYATRWLRYVVGENDPLDNEMALALKEFGINGATGAHVRWLRRAAINSERPVTYLAHAIKGWQFVAKIGLNTNIIGSNGTQAPLTIVTRYGWGTYFKALKSALGDQQMKQLFEATRLSEEIGRDSLGQEALRVKTMSERTQELATTGFRNTEVVNRATAFQAGRLIAHEAGHLQPEQVMAGILEVDMTQFNLGRSGRIPFLRGQAASTIFQFSPYRVEMMRLIGSMVKGSIGEAAKLTGRKAAGPLPPTSTQFINTKRLVRLAIALQAVGGINATFGPLLRFFSADDDPEFADALHAIDAMSIDYQLGKATTGAPFEFGYRINPIWLISGKFPGPAFGMIQDVWGATFGYPGSPTLAQTAVRNLPYGVQLERSFGEELEPYTRKIFGPKQGRLHGGRTVMERIFGPNPQPKPGDFKSR